MIEPDLCYRALASRDARFDGRFFVGVRTTGVYCRPICPARTPKRANVSFFACAAVAEGEVVLDGSRDPDAVMESLMSLRGIGPWTAQVVAMRALGEPDAFPAGDLGLGRALARGGRVPGRRQINEIAERWRPWRAYATFYLWLSESEGREAG